MNHATVFLFASLLVLFACGQVQESEPAPAPAPERNAPSPMEATEPTAEETSPEMPDSDADRAVADLDPNSALSASPADGVWMTNSGSVSFGTPESEPRVSFACGDYGMIDVTRPIRVDPNMPVRGMIATGNGSADAYWQGGMDEALPRATMEVSASDPVFETLADADRIALLAAGHDDLTVPASSELAALIQSCRDREL